MEILGEHIDKKHALYIGGAIASVVGLIWLMKRQSSAQTVAAPAGAVPSSAATGASAQDAQIAAQLAIEQGREQIATAQIASAEKIAALQSATAITTAGYASTAKQVGALAPGIGAAGATATKGIFDILKEWLAPGSTTGAPGGGQIYPEPIGPNLPEGYVIDNTNPGAIYDYPIGPNLPIDTSGYNTTTSGGSSDWFGGGLPSEGGGEM
jgi:hypothetical protein